MEGITNINNKIRYNKKHIKERVIGLKNILRKMFLKTPICLIVAVMFLIFFAESWTSIQDVEILENENVFVSEEKLNTSIYKIELADIYYDGSDKLNLYSLTKSKYKSTISYYFLTKEKIDENITSVKGTEYEFNFAISGNETVVKIPLERNGKQIVAYNKEMLNYDDIDSINQQFLVNKFKAETSVALILYSLLDVFLCAVLSVLEYEFKDRLAVKCGLIDEWYE